MASIHTDISVLSNSIFQKQTIHTMIKCKKELGLLFSLLLLFAVQVNAQQSFNSASNQAIINGYQFEYAIGEMALISTEKSNNLIVTQGFFQPASLRATSESEQSNPKNWASLVKVFPNPTQDVITLEVDAVNKTKYAVQLTDATGKLIRDISFESKLGVNQERIDLSVLSSGNYFIIIRKADNSSVSFKIQKVSK